jgi:hypothetical protein
MLFSQFLHKKIENKAVVTVCGFSGNNVWCQVSVKAVLTPDI